MRAGRKATGLMESAGLPTCTHAHSPHSSSFSPPRFWRPRRSPTRSRATVPRSPRPRAPTRTRARRRQPPRIRRATLCLHNQVRAAARPAAACARTRTLRKAAARPLAQHGPARLLRAHHADRRDVVDRILRADYVREDQGWALGENLAWGTGSLGTPRGAVQAWIESPGHRANILRRTYRELGIGVATRRPGLGRGRRDLHRGLRSPPLASAAEWPTSSPSAPSTTTSSASAASPPSSPRPTT